MIYRRRNCVAGTRNLHRRRSVVPPAKARLLVRNPNLARDLKEAPPREVPRNVRPAANRIALKAVLWKMNRLQSARTAAYHSGSPAAMPVTVLTLTPLYSPMSFRASRSEPT